MTQYIGTKVLLDAISMTKKEYCAYRGWTIPSNEDPNEAGFLVEYADGGKPNDSRHEGYISWSPADVFKQSYRPTIGMTFGQAIEALKAGKKVARKGWNGKGMFLWLKPATTIKSEWCKDPLLKNLVDSNNGELLALGTVCMYTHDGTGRRAILTGWLASQSDMLLEDWEVVE